MYYEPHLTFKHLYAICGGCMRGNDKCMHIFRMYASHQPENLGPLGVELDAEERVDENEDKPDELEMEGMNEFKK